MPDFSPETADPQLWVFLSALFVPLLNSVINKPHWTAATKRSVMVLSVLGVSCFWIWQTGQYKQTDMTTTIRTVLLTVGAVYALFKDPLKQIESTVNAGDKPAKE
jgi:hypothetical protein